MSRYWKFQTRRFYPNNSILRISVESLVGRLISCLTACEEFLKVIQFFLESGETVPYFCYIDSIACAPIYVCHALNPLSVSCQFCIMQSELIHKYFSFVLGDSHSTFKCLYHFFK
jgi:hypothetical protein